MANTVKKLYAGAPGTTSTVLYTTPANTKTIVKNLVISNITSANATSTINFGGIGLINDYPVSPKDTVVIELSLILEAGETITSIQGTTSALNIHISGVEVS